MSESGAASVGASDASAEVVGAETAEGRERRRHKLEAAVAYHERDLGFVDAAAERNARRSEGLRSELEAAEAEAGQLAALRAGTLGLIEQARAELDAFDGGGG